MDWEDIVWTVSGCFSGAAILISLYHIYKHLRNWTIPSEQKYIVRLLLMVPIYSVDSWLGIRFRQYALYFDAARDCYEAYALYQFFALLMAYLNGKEQTRIDYILSEKAPISHPCPLCCLPRMKPGPWFLLITKQAILQYVVIKPLMGILSAILYATGELDEGNFHPTSAYLYITVIVNLSVTISLYCLVLFYIATSEELKPFKPIAKFICIKAILFFSFWQGVAIGFLSYFDVIREVGDWEKEEIAVGLQDFLICIEMFILAVAHYYVFGYQPYIDPERISWRQWKSPQDAFQAIHQPISNFKHIVDQRDLVTDLTSVYNPQKVRQARRDHREIKKRYKKTDTEIEIPDVNSIPPKENSADSSIVTLEESYHDDSSKIEDSSVESNK